MTSEEPPGDRSICVRLPARLGSARVARRLLDELLVRAGVSRRSAQDAELVLHELVMNGVTHGRGDERGEIGVVCTIEGQELEIRVQDHGSGGHVAVRPATEDLDSGRGLAIVAALSQSWAVDRSAGTLVAARMAL
jgi:serine/threonine-protein kinase RsbW